MITHTPQTQLEVLLRIARQTANNVKCEQMSNRLNRIIEDAEKTLMPIVKRERGYRYDETA